MDTEYQESAETMVVPISARGQLNQRSDEMAAVLTVLAYTDARDALLNALGE